MSEVGMRSISEKETTEIPKHRKKKQSSTSNARTKSKHKHIYKDCLFLTTNMKNIIRESIALFAEG